MVGYDPKQVQLSKFEIGLAGFITGCVSRAIIQPFDVLKIRFQVQYEPINRKSANSKYKGILNAIYTIYKDEGIKSFWKGHLTGQMLSTSFIAIQFTSLELLTKYAFTSVDNKQSRDFVCGGLAASISVMCVQPLDVVRTRFVAQGEPKLYKTIYNAFELILKNEGVKGLYKGLIPSLVQMTPQTAVTFSLYGLLNTYWKRFTDPEQNIDLKNTASGFVSGVAGKSIIYPFDVIKKRLQIQGFEEARRPFGKVVYYNGISDCFHSTFKHEGIKGLYKGYLPGMLKAGSTSAIVFFLYERTTLFMRVLKHVE